MDPDFRNHEGKITLGVIVFVFGLAVIFAWWMSGRYASAFPDLPGIGMLLLGAGVLLSLAGLVLMKLG